MQASTTVVGIIRGPVLIKLNECISTEHSQSKNKSFVLVVLFDLGTLSSREDPPAFPTCKVSSFGYYYVFFAMLCFFKSVCHFRYFSLLMEQSILLLFTTL